MRDYEVETWAPDFDDVRLDTMIIFEKMCPSNLWTYQFGVDDVMKDLVLGDLMRVIVMRGRPREAQIEVLRTAKTFRVRVDQLLEWHDTELITILPG